MVVSFEEVLSTIIENIFIITLIVEASKKFICNRISLVIRDLRKKKWSASSTPIICWSNELLHIHIVDILNWCPCVDCDGDWAGNETSIQCYGRSKGKDRWKLGTHQCSFYSEIWNIIDDKLDRQLHRDLHASWYYLNRRF